MSSDGEIHVDGRVLGDVRCVTLVIGEEGVVTGEILAETVRVLGTVNGQISAHAVELAKSACIMGDITHESLAVEAGAHVEGRFNRRAPDGAKPAEQPVKGLEQSVIKRTVLETGADISAPKEETPKANLIMLGNG